MSARCPQCLKPLPAMDLPVCAHCGARLEPRPQAPPEEPAAGLPLRAGEAAAELLARFFSPPDVYIASWTGYGLTVLAAAALPVGLLWWPAPWPAAVAVVAGSWFLALYHGLHRWPPRTRVVFDRRGVEQCGLLLRWEHLATAETAGYRRRRIEPERLILRDGRGRQVVVSAECTHTGRIRSLRNLAAVVTAVIAALREQDSSA